jgi:opacity protein-like surface antigen
MKTNHCLSVVTAVAIATATSLRADDSMSNNDSLSSKDQGPHYEQTETYRANELSVDAFGTAAQGEYTIEHLASMSANSIRQNTKWGAGAGLNYFATHYLGIGAEGYWQNNHGGTFVNSASGNLMLRLPLGESGLAPYILGGGGHQFDGGKYWFGQAGGGLEYRFWAHLGIFVDARAVWLNETKSYGVARAGLRFSF